MSQPTRLRRRTPLAALVALVAAACGSPQPQSHECARFVTCVKALDQQRQRKTNVVRYEPGGPCWKGEAGAELCTISCERGFPLLARGVDPVPPECAP